MARFNPAEYDDVNSRIDKFWEAYPEGRLITALVSDPNALDEVVFKASVYLTRDDDRPVSVGWAFEHRGKSINDGANFTHHLENAETSSIGRALANLNFKTRKDSPRPSRQEMEKTERQVPAQTPEQKAEATATTASTDITRPMTEEQKQKILAKCRRLKQPVPDMKGWTQIKAMEHYRQLRKIESDQIAAQQQNNPTKTAANAR